MPAAPARLRRRAVASRARPARPSVGAVRAASPAAWGWCRAVVLHSDRLAAPDPVAAVARQPVRFAGRQWYPAAAPMAASAPVPAKPTLTAGSAPARRDPAATQGPPP